ncbi:MAG: FHA domain-containing protein [Planctomycetota bacterium]|nr:MAG: FHA domain-containing protein [Planctomycetota bacterium]
MNVNLLLFKKNGSHKIIPLPSSATIIGRRRSCDLHIPLASVSRRHCQLNHDNGVWRIRDVGSRNGTYLNGKRVEEAEIKAGDSVRIGPLAFVFQVDGEPVTTIQPDLVVISSSQRDSPTEDALDEQFGSAIELDDIEGVELDDSNLLLDDPDLFGDAD